MEVNARYQRRFILQSDSYSCGPVAIHNAMVWGRGLSPSWALLRSECKPCPEGGTSRHHILLSYTAMQTSKPAVMYEWFKQGHGIVLLYCQDDNACTNPACSKEWCGKEPHYVFAHPHSSNFSRDRKVMVRNAICYQNVPDYHHTVQTWANFERVFLKKDAWHDCGGILQTYPHAWRITHKS